jgi:hypothetical protein
LLSAPLYYPLGQANRLPHVEVIVVVCLLLHGHHLLPLPLVPVERRVGRLLLRLPVCASREVRIQRRELRVLLEDMAVLENKSNLRTSGLWARGGGGGWPPPVQLNIA